MIRALAFAWIEMRLLTQYRKWRSWGFTRKNSLYLAIKYINL